MSKQAIDALRSKISLPWTIFFTSAGAAVVLSYRDIHLSNQVTKGLIERAKPLADEPLPVNEMPRKVVVYLSAPPGDGLHKSRAFFTRYIKPIWDAAALDYEIKEGGKPGDIQRYVRNSVRRQRRKSALNPNEISPLKELDGSVAVGRTAFVEMVNGLSDGSFGPVFERQKVSEREEPVKENAEGVIEKEDGQKDQVKKDEEITNQTAETEKLEKPKKKSKLEIEEEQAAVEGSTIPEDILSTLESSQIPPRLPPIGFITLRNVIGWAHLPYRIFAWFTDYQQVDTFGEQALKIAMDQKQKLKNFAELDTIGSEEKAEIQRWGAEEKKLTVDGRVMEVLDMYV